jgi:hypothetical protein
VISDIDHVRVSDLAAGLGYTVEPLETGRVCVHGVDYNAIPSLVRVLAEAGVALYGVDVEQPTLTDLYLALHRADAPGADAPGADAAGADAHGADAPDRHSSDLGSVDEA